MNTLFPIVTDYNQNLFVSEDKSHWRDEEVEGFKYATGALKLLSTTTGYTLSVDAMALTQTSDLLDAGVVDPTDTLDQIKLDKILFQHAGKTWWVPIHKVLQNGVMPSRFSLACLSEFVLRESRELAGFVVAVDGRFETGELNINVLVCGAGGRAIPWDQEIGGSVIKPLGVTFSVGRTNYNRRQFAEPAVIEETV